MLLHVVLLYGNMREGKYMCGFVGFTGRLEDKREYLNRMMDRIIHRGPDMAGEYLDDDVALGFRRLSIIDLSEAGRQPMCSEDGNTVIVFNGEIYNFMELRRELEEKGHTFHTDTDTESLIHGYEEYGEELVRHLRGMFAFVIWDKRRKLLYGARDFFGIKPFYYGKLKNGELIFGSEIKSFLDHPEFEKKLNRAALRPYLTFQYSATEETFFAGVYKLPPAHFFVYQNGNMHTERYWDVNFDSSANHETLQECADTIDRTVHESVAAHRIADVKVGTFLSGGVDSSYITAAMMPQKTFSVGFDYHKFDETNYAKELSDRLEIQNFREMLTAEECFEALPTIQYHMDEPQSNPSSVPLYFLAKLASEHVTVVLSGEGADEIYAGYEWYDIWPNARAYQKIPRCIRTLLSRVVRHLPYFHGHDLIVRSSGCPKDYFIGQAEVYRPKEADALLQDAYRVGPTPRKITAPIYERVCGKDELSQKQYLDLNLWMPGDILLKADKMSMAHSLELRVPFLDRKVMAQAQTIPPRYKINGKNTKYVMRMAANKTLPDDWANRPKKGFPVPIRYWFTEEKWYQYAKSYFCSDYAAEFFHTERLMKLLDAHYRGEANNGRKIWTALVFLVWYKRFFVDEQSEASSL